MAIATRKLERLGTVWTATATLMSSSGKAIAYCIDTPNAIAKALMEMPGAKTVRGLEGTHGRNYWETRMKPWNNAKSGLIKTGGSPKPNTKVKETWQMAQSEAAVPTRLELSQLQSYDE